MSRHKLPPEPIDRRGSSTEADLSCEISPRRDKPPPPRLDSMTFPINRLPQLDVPILKRIPNVGENPDENISRNNFNVDPSLPLPVVPEKTMYNLWEKTQTQTDVRWTPPENAKDFRSLSYEIQLRSGDGEWQRLTENWQPLYRVYYTEGKALFGRTRLSQDECTTVVFLRIRPIGVLDGEGGVSEKKLGPWSENIMFSLERKQ